MSRGRQRVNHARPQLRDNVRRRYGHVNLRRELYFREWFGGRVRLMGVAAVDQVLYEIVSGAAPTTIADVLGTMQRIDQALRDNDGLKWFNRLYMMVTQE